MKKGLKNDLKNFMENPDSLKKRIILAICLLAGGILALAGGTAAIYTSQVFQRSVVRNRDNDIIRFSSDKLYRVTAGTAAQKYYYPVGREQKTMSFQVCNYDQAKNTLFSEKRINYGITFRILNGTAGFTYTISDGNSTQSAPTGDSVSFTSSLKGGTRSANTYSFTFDEEDYNKVELHVTVTPEDLAITQNRILNGILIPSEYVTTQGVTVKSEFTDSTRGTPDQFDAYNFSVSISGGSGDVLIIWDHTMLDIDPFFAAGKTVTDSGKESVLTVHMNSEDTTGTYLVQFYNHNTTAPGWTSWSEVPVRAELADTSS